MKKRILLIMFATMLLFTDNVDAKWINADDVEKNTYIIGDHYFNRTKNDDNGYDGQLTIDKIMEAVNSSNEDALESVTELEQSKRGDGSYVYDNLTIYYKNFLGEWINGVTGEDIDVPDYLFISNRNLKDIITNPNLECFFETESSTATTITKKITCGSSVTVDGVLNYDESLNGADGVEYYILKNEDESLPDDVSFKFSGWQESTGGGNNAITPVLLTEDNSTYSYGVDETEPLYHIVGRYYYLDGNEKIYGAWSNIVSNKDSVTGVSNDFSNLKLTATINTNYNINFVDVDGGGSKIRLKYCLGPEEIDSTYYPYDDDTAACTSDTEVFVTNGEFDVSGLDETKYTLYDLKVYSTIKASDTYNYANSSGSERDAAGLSNPYSLVWDLHKETINKNLYTSSIKFKSSSTQNVPNTPMYLIAGTNVAGNGQTYSKRLFSANDSSESRVVVGIATICNVDDSTFSNCFEKRLVATAELNTQK